MTTACVKRAHRARGVFQFAGVRVSRNQTRRHPVYSMMRQSCAIWSLLYAENRRAEPIWQ